MPITVNCWGACENDDVSSLRPYTLRRRVQCQQVSREETKQALAGTAALDDKSASPFHAESSDLADNIDVLCGTITALEKGASWSSFFQSHVGPAILTNEGSSHVTSAPIGLETTDEVVTKLLERNTTIHTKKGQTFTMCAITQLGVLIQVEGE